MPARTFNNIFSPAHDLMAPASTWGSRREQRVGAGVRAAAAMSVFIAVWAHLEALSNPGFVDEKLARSIPQLLPDLAASGC